MLCPDSEKTGVTNRSASYTKRLLAKGIKFYTWVLELLAKLVSLVIIFTILGKVKTNNLSYPKDL